jgi:hypothetical protein
MARRRKPPGRSLWSRPPPTPRQTTSQRAHKGTVTPWSGAGPSARELMRAKSTIPTSAAQATMSSHLLPRRSQGFS